MNARRISLPAAVALLLLVLAPARPGQAQSPAGQAAPQGAGPAALNAGVAVAQAPSSLEVPVGKSVVVTAAEDIRRVSLASQEAADVLLLSARQVYVTGKAPGATNLTLWGKNDKVMAVFDVDVSPDATLLKRTLASALPNERGIRIVSNGRGIALTGSVSSAPALATALALAETFAPGKVTNLLSVGGVHQVMLEVRVAEMSRTVLQRFGIDFNLITGGHVVQAMLGGLVKTSGATQVLTDSVTGVVTPNLGGSMSLTAFLNALKDNGLVKVLAEPNLICLSGKSANFLAGGEIPIPVPQALGTVAIEYKPFGVGLSFTPTVLDSGRISIQVNPEVSELDYSLGVSLNTWQIPGLTTRRVSTTVELGNGQSFAIAGLIKDTARESIKKFPGLGDLPVLGALFRSSEFRKNETELVIIVTPHLVKPLDMARQTLPTDGFREPTPYEFFVQGKQEGDAPAPKTDKKAPGPISEAIRPQGFDGSYGQALPGAQ